MLNSIVVVPPSRSRKIQPPCYVAFRQKLSRRKHNFSWLEKNDVVIWTPNGVWNVIFEFKYGRLFVKYFWKNFVLRNLYSKQCSYTLVCDSHGRNSMFWLSKVCLRYEWKIRAENPFRSITNKYRDCRCLFTFFFVLTTLIR